jgi:hypothetical protein
MKTLKEQIEVMQAFAEGKQVEYCGEPTGGAWLDASTPVWDWHTKDYRIKPVVERTVVLGSRWRHLSSGDTYILANIIVKSGGCGTDNLTLINLRTGMMYDHLLIVERGVIGQFNRLKYINILLDGFEEIK